MANSNNPMHRLDRRDALRLVLVGKTGVGKSSSGNTILGREEFESDIAPTSVTSQCAKKRRRMDGREVYVIDTPGLFDTNHSKSEILTEIAKCICLSSPGPHAFLVTIQLGRFTEEEQKTVEMIQQIFGEQSAKYTIVLFSHGDRLKKKTFQEFLSQSKELQKLIDQCHGRYHVFNNEDSENHSQVTELLQKIDEMVAVNGGGYYTNEMYQQIEEEIEKETEAILKETEERREREKDELREKLEYKMLERALKDLETRQREQARWKAEHRNAFVLDCTISGAGAGAASFALVGALVGLVFGPLGILGGGLIGAGLGAAGGAGVGAGLARDKCTVQ